MASTPTLFLLLPESEDVGIVEKALRSAGIQVRKSVSPAELGPLADTGNAVLVLIDAAGFADDPSELAETLRGRFKAILSNGLEELMIPSRREITVVFVDLRGFTRFSALSEPEEVISVLRQYHELVGRAVESEEETVERFAGDGQRLRHYWHRGF